MSGSTRAVTDKIINDKRAPITDKPYPAITMEVNYLS